MIKILDIKISKEIQLVLGTSVEVIAVLNEDKPTSIKITIEDPGTVDKVADVNMDRVNSRIYNYVYQSASTDVEGDYLARITVVKGGKTAVREKIFTMIDQDIRTKNNVW